MVGLLIKNIILGLLLAAAATLSACKSETPPTPPVVQPDPCHQRSEPAYGLGQITTPGFEEDIKPILMSTQTGKVYKCTTCHQSYLDIAIVGRQSEIDSIIKSLESSYMPLNGDKVSAGEIALMRDWAAAGFPALRLSLPASGAGGDPWGGQQPSQNASEKALEDDLNDCK